MKIKYLITFSILFVGIGIFGQENVSLIEIAKAKEFLKLNKAQVEKIVPKIERILKITDEDNKILLALKERFRKGDEPSFFEKVKAKFARGKRENEVSDLIDEIEDLLTEEQKIKFEEMNKPYLPELTKADITGEK